MGPLAVKEAGGVNFCRWSKVQGCGTVLVASINISDLAIM